MPRKYTPADCLALYQSRIREVAEPRACWPWSGSFNNTDYGISYWNGKTELAHRIAYTLASGEPLSPDFDVLHTCDVRACTRNDDVGTYEVAGLILPRYGHLFRGSQVLNVLDMKAKGRATSPSGDNSWTRQRPELLARGERNGAYTHPERRPRGEDHGSAVLTAADVLDIRARAECGEALTWIAERYHTTKTNISYIVRRKTWKELRRP